MNTNKLALALFALIVLYSACKTDNINKGTGKKDTTVVTKPCSQGSPRLDWAKQISGGGADEEFSIAFDAAGNLILTGGFNGTMDFDPGTGVHNLTGPSLSDTTFTLKLDTAGKFLQASITHDMFSNFPVQYGTQARLQDAAGNLYTLGELQGTDDFDPGAGVYNLTYNGPVDPNDFSVPYGFYIQKLDATGHFVYALLTGLTTETTTHDGAQATFVVDSAGNTFTAGYGPGLTKMGYGYFLQKYDPAGKLLWEKKTGLSNSAAMLIDAEGNIYVGGAGGTVNKYSGTGQLVRTITIQDNNGYGIYCLTTDVQNNIYIGGLKNNDLFIQKTDASGNLVWYISSTNKYIAGDHLNVATLSTIKVDAVSHNVYAFGQFVNGPFTFGSGTDTLQMTANGRSFFVLKYKQCY